MIQHRAIEPESPPLLSHEKREWLAGYAFAGPWLVGFLVLGAGPIAMSLGYSLCRYDVLRPPMFVGLENYRYLLFELPKFYTSILNTVYYTLLRVPLVIVGSLALALLVAKPAPGVGLGLSLCRRLAQSIGGELILEQNSDEGATFSLLLPCLQEN